MSKGYIPKDLSFDNEAREKLIKGITKISKAVKSTLDPSRSNCINRISRSFRWNHNNKRWSDCCQGHLLR